jgi:regulator of nonsense transcripts 2
VNAQARQIDDRAPSPDEEIVLSASHSKQENLGPSEEADADFAKELAKLVTDTSAESRRVDKKTALALWDSAVPPPTSRKKKIHDDNDEDENVKDNESPSMMNFTVITKRGNKQLVSFFHATPDAGIDFVQHRQLAVPSASALAVHTRSAQLQDKVEQQQLKRLVLNYEQREEAEELKGRKRSVLLSQMHC